MTEYKSEVKTICSPQTSVYNRLSDLSHMQVIQEHLDDENAKQRILEQAGKEITSEQLDQVIEKLRGLQFTADSVSSSSPMGDLTLRIVEREEPKTVKFELEGAPLQANMWIQLLPTAEGNCAMRITVKADINFFLRQMLGNKLQKGVDGLATLLSRIPY